MHDGPSENAEGQGLQEGLVRRIAAQRKERSINDQQKAAWENYDCGSITTASQRVKNRNVCDRTRADQLPDSYSALLQQFGKGSSSSSSSSRRQPLCCRAPNAKGCARSC
jgi:hypothetical protein